MHTPDALLRVAAHESLNFEFETHCVLATFRRWGRLVEAGRLFVNISAEVLVQVLDQHGHLALLELIGRFGVMSRKLVLEITEYERVVDMDRLATTMSADRDRVCRARAGTL